jgi:chromosome segregation protein
MKIKRLEIVGFKSFVDKVTLDFRQGITGVVGPNGCGKSNIVDAIRWAMGEQNVRHLRGRAMEDIIFGGCETRKPHGMARVSIVFDNSARICPPAYKEYSEIMVTRGLYRNGDSEYLINKTPCRLLDITELFMDTGVGARAYSIIEQGKVGMLISSKPEERRVLIEEVAGVTKYKSRKKSALRKMEATKQNLVRLSDLIAEVRRQMGSLKRQAQRAEKFRDLRIEQKKIELALSGHRFQKLQEEIKKNAAKEAEQGKLLQSYDTRLAEDELHLEERQLQLANLETEHRDAQDRVYRLGSEVQRVENSLQLNMRQREHLTELEQQLAGELDSVATRLKLLDEESLELRDRDNSSVLESEKLAQLVAEGERLLQEKQEQEQQQRSRLESNQTELMTLVTRRNQLLNRCSDIGQRLKHEEERRRQLEGDSAQIKSLQQQLSDRAETFEAQLDRLRTEQDLLQERLADYEEQQFVQQRDLEQRQSELNDVRLQLDKQRSRYESLLELQEGLEGYAEGTRLLLDTVATKQIMADLIQVPQEYEVAVETALGEQLQAVPTETSAVSAVVAKLTQERVRGSLVLARISSVGFTTQIGQPLLDLVRVKSGGDSLAMQLLIGVYLVDDCCACLDVKLAAGEMLVDQVGNCLDWRGVFKGGIANTDGAGLLRRQRQLGELEEEISLLEENWRRREQAVAELREQQQELNEARRIAAADGHRLELQLLELSKDRQQLESEEEQLGKRLVLLNYDIEQINENSQTLVHEREQAEKEIAEISAGEQQLESLNAHLRDEVAKSGEELKLFQEELTENKMRLASLGEQKKAQQEAIQRIDSQREDLEQRRVQLGQRRINGQAEHERLNKDDERLKIELNLLLERRESQRQAAEKLRIGHDEGRMQLDEFRDQLRHFRQEAEELRKQVSALQLRQREQMVDADHVRQGILDRYAVDLTDHPKVEMTEGEIEQQQQLLKKLQHQIAVLGDVNLMAIDEYSEQEQRYDFLTQQRDDLNHAMDDLQKAIGQINRTTRRRFKETFDLVNEKFRQVFPRLFRGGQAELRLTDEDDLLETGIEIIVQPPGKRLQNVNLLSGGEKALTAVALIFSLFLIKPTPFCILDEVDAPLDDANIDRFAEMVKEMTEQSQFIIITHSKRTMSVVDTMYGVTMQEPGISKLVSVKMNEAVA